MIFKSQFLQQASGSLGGVTYSHNRGGMYTRQRSIPTNPNSPQQQAVRAIFGSLSILWQSTLTSAQRSAWTDYAAVISWLNALGDGITLTGQQMYVRCNTPRIQAGLARVDDGPTVGNLGDYTNPSFAYDSANSEMDVTFDNTDSWANEDDSAMLIYTSRQRAPTINFFKGPYQLAGIIAGDSVTPPTSPAAIAAPFVCAAGNRCFARAIVTRADGRLSEPFRGYGLGA